MFFDGAMGIWFSVFTSFFSAAVPLPPTLVDTGFEQSEKIYFEPQYPLWSDGLHKERWFSLPVGTQIDNSQTMDFNFPVGTKAWKEFSAIQADGTKFKIETRYIEKLATGFAIATYQWSADQTKATLVRPGGIPQAYPLPGGAGHSIPARGQCMACHMGKQDLFLGLNGLQLSEKVDTPRDVKSIDLVKMEQRGMLQFSVAIQPTIQASSPSAKKAMGYLVGNCANCHRPGSYGEYSGLFLNIDPSLSDESAQNVFLTAVNQHSNFSIPGQAGETYRIKSGEPTKSAILYRMNTRTPAQMPPFGSVVIDDAGTEKIKNWILSL